MSLNLRERLALYLYSAVLFLARPLLRRKLRRRGQVEPGYLEAIPERLGHYSTPPPHRPVLWLHAVSLGETRAASILLTALRAQWPDHTLLFTHGTATGRAEGQRWLRPGDLQTWLPWDEPGCVTRFLAHHRPWLGLLMETEVWPNLVDQAHRLNVPLWLVNARLSDKSMRHAQRLAWLARPAYGRLAGVLAQSEADAQRLRELGAPVQGVTGNLKFDVPPQPELQAGGRAFRQALDRPVVMLASSRDGEERWFLEELYKKWDAPLDSHAYDAIKNIVKNVIWVLVPRHPQRFDDVAALAQSLGWRVYRRSQGGWQAEVSTKPDQPELWLGDTLGEMAWYYSLSDVALLGGSFGPWGGQNLIEAAAFGCPVVLGPSTYNFAEAAEGAVAAGAAFRVADMAEGLAQALRLLSTPNAELAQAATLRFVGQHRGAAARTAATVATAVVKPRDNT